MSIPALHVTHHEGMTGFDAPAERMQALVDDILERMTKAGIPWCLLRNRDLIPWGLLQWSDLDIMVPASVSHERLVSLFRDLQPTQIVPFRDGVTYMFFPFDAMFLRVDIIHGDTGWLGAPYSDNEEILADRRDDDGIMVASPLHQAYLTWCNRLVRGGELPERYQMMIREQVREHPGAFRQLLERHIGSNQAGALMRLAETGRLDKTPRYAQAFKRALWLSAARRHPARTIRSTAHHLGYGIRRRIHPSGMEIVVLSADRSAATGLCTAFAHSTFRCVPGLAAEYRPLPMERVDARRPLPGSLTYIAELWFDRAVRDRGARARMMFIFRDHDISELSINPARIRYRGPTLIARWARHFLPSASLVVVLDTGWGSMNTRESHLNEAYRNLRRAPTHAVVIDATLNVPDLMTAVSSTISARLLTGESGNQSFGRSLRIVSGREIAGRHQRATGIVARKLGMSPR